MSFMRLGLMMVAWLSLTLVTWTEGYAKPTVYVVNYPLQYFTERIGAAHIQVVFPAPAGTDPAFWKPDVKTIVAFQAADLIVLNGATYAKWLKTASLPKAKLVNTSTGFEAQYIEIKDTMTHRHGPAGEHSHTSTAFTTWLNLHQATQQAQAIANALSRLLPQQKNSLQQNYTELAQDLLALDQRLETIVANQQTPRLLASHPVYQYLADRYGLNLRSVLWQPDIMPDIAQWQALQTILQTHDAKWMLWESEPLTASATKLQTLGVKSLVFDPCGNTPEQGDFLSVMQQNIKNLRQAFQ